MIPRNLASFFDVIFTVILSFEPLNGTRYLDGKGFSFLSSGKTNFNLDNSGRISLN